MKMNLLALSLVTIFVSTGVADIIPSKEDVYAKCETEIAMFMEEKYLREDASAAFCKFENVQLAQVLYTSETVSVFELFVEVAADGLTKKLLLTTRLAKF